MRRRRLSGQHLPDRLQEVPREALSREIILVVKATSMIRLGPSRHLTLAAPNERYALIPLEQQSIDASLSRRVNHTTYHRGRIAKILFEVPAGNAMTDFPVLLARVSPQM